MFYVGGIAMFTKKIYFAGGNFHELQEVFSRISGVEATQAGYIDSSLPSPSYEAVVTGRTGAAMGVEVCYDPKKIDLSSLIDILFAVVNPYAKDKQGDCEGPMYRSGVYYISADDEPIVEYHMNFIHNRQKTPAVTGAKLTLNDPNSDPTGPRKCYAEAQQLKSFYPAEETHQDYFRHHLRENTYIDFKRLKALAIIQ
jgi:peptide-methionine (S)-S-oxide reductase